MLGISTSALTAWRRYENRRRYRELAAAPLSADDCPCLGRHCPSMGRRLKSERVCRVFSSTAYRCAQCRLVYFDPQPAASTLTEFYSTPGDAGYAAQLRGWTARDLTEEQRSFCRQKLENLETQWRKAVPLAEDRKPKFVEVGIGNAHMLAVARDVLGWTASGVDVSHPLAEDARRGFGLEIIERDLSTSDCGHDLPTGVDIVLAEHTLEHTRHPGQVLRNIAAMLAPGGIAVIMVPNGQSLQSLRDFSGWAWGNYPVHLYFFTRRSFEMSFAKAGMECESFDSAVYNDEGEQATGKVLRSVLGLEETADVADYFPAMRESLLLPELCVVARKRVDAV
jgi:SAM-dependent methyltransferase